MTTSVPDFDFSTSKVEVLEDTPLGGGLKILVLKLAKESLLPYSASGQLELKRLFTGAYNDTTRKFSAALFAAGGYIDLSDYGIATDGVFYANAMMKGRDTVDGVPIQYPFTGTFSESNPGVNPASDSVWSVVKNMAFRIKGRNSAQGTDHHFNLAPVIRSVAVQNSGYIGGPPTGGRGGGGLSENAESINSIITVGLSMNTLMGGSDNKDYSIGRTTGSHSIGSTSNITIQASGNNNLQKFASTGDYALAMDTDGKFKLVGKITVVDASNFNVADGIAIPVSANRGVAIIPQGFMENCEGVILTIIGRKG